MIGLDNSILYTALPVLDTQLDTTATESLRINTVPPPSASRSRRGGGARPDRPLSAYNGPEERHIER